MTTLLGVGSLLFQAVGTKQSADAQERQGEASAEIGEFNAQLSEQNAVIARDNALADEIAIRKGAERLKGKQRATFASSGVDVGEGSPLLVLAETAREAELEALTVRDRGELQAKGFEAEAISERFTGGQQRTAGITGARSTILSGAGRALQSGFKFKQSGVF